ncbi:hypothetical protein D917_00247 [Trichinella nativa]|uniref:Uncharacterized protein n=1 Tax=Trichinella nativa TaxID=6335 RepID=A0A1Y3EF66_9BILA|nr:hypothetical protein D917_00247 [Trichinella nativa]
MYLNIKQQLRPTWAQFLDRQLEHLQSGWLSEIVKVIESKAPKVLAIHFQEIGGKEFKENMHQMKHFFQKLYTILSEKFNLRRGLGYYDQDFTNVDTHWGCCTCSTTTSKRRQFAISKLEILMPLKILP